MQVIKPIKHECAHELRMLSEDIFIKTRNYWLFLWMIHQIEWFYNILNFDACHENFLNILSSFDELLMSNRICLVIFIRIKKTKDFIWCPIWHRTHNCWEVNKRCWISMPLCNDRGEIVVHLSNKDHCRLKRHVLPLQLLDERYVCWIMCHNFLF